MIMDIITAISTLIAQQSDAIVHLSNQGEGFERPSFFISQINSATKDMNKFTMDNNIFIQIVYYAPFVDDYTNVDAVDQYNMSDSIKEIFKIGYFTVGDRAVKVAQMTGGPRDKEVYITLNLTLTEDKQPTPTQVPMIGTVKLNLNIESEDQ
ncbi:DUF6838 family protein [Clostridium sp.]|uniref:phage tail terminator family protein n=1 Tax=Clostridium sp. TaxID=1506 RepID=UPI0028441CC2|nr:hypothetical protein [Clostridium sp.]MDR3595104.1 hypothetical protein [Clostridium sp.]